MAAAVVLFLPARRCSDGVYSSPPDSIPPNPPESSSFRKVWHVPPSHVTLGFPSRHSSNKRFPLFCLTHGYRHDHVPRNPPPISSGAARWQRRSLLPKPPRKRGRKRERERKRERGQRLFLFSRFAWWAETRWGGEFSTQVEHLASELNTK